MYGKTIIKYCNVCKEDVKINISVCLMGSTKTKDNQYQ